MNRMTQALAVSDTHGNRQILPQIARQFPDVRYVFHLGDGVRDAVWLADHMPDSTVVNVKGNCDWSSECNDFEELTIAGQKIVLTHGHLLQVKYGYDRLLYYAQERNAQAVLFGHTHQAYIERVDGIWLINPGSAGEPRGGAQPTVAILLIGEVGIVPKLLPLRTL